LSYDSGITWTNQTYDHYFEVWGSPVLEIVNAKVFRNYLSTGDWLITSEITNVMPPYYDNNEDPSTRFVFQFMGTTGTAYASTPVELWDKNPISIYLNPTQTGMLSWGGAYKCRLSNLAGSTYADYTLRSTDWNAASLIYLDNWVRNCAKDMETYQQTRKGKTTTYLTYVADKGWVLNQDGGAIFNEAIPRLQNVRPNIFQVTSTYPEITTTTGAMPGIAKMDYHTRLGSYLSGLVDQFVGVSGIQDPKTAGGVIMIGIYALIAFGTVIKGYAWAGLIAAVPVLFAGIYYGLLDAQLFLVVLVIIAFLFVREFVFKGG